MTHQKSLRLASNPDDKGILLQEIQILNDGHIVFAPYDKPTHVEYIILVTKPGLSSLDDPAYVD